MPKKKSNQIWVPTATCLNDLVQDYLTKPYYGKISKGRTKKQELEDHLDSLHNLVDFICGCPNPPDALKTGKFLYGVHQRHYCHYKNLVPNLYDLLKDIDQKKFNNFEDLHDKVLSIKLNNEEKVKGFGWLGIYDFALRVAWKLNRSIEPKEYVYLHSWPCESAKILVAKGKLPCVGLRMKFDLFPADFRSPGMTAKDVENLLCHYYGDICRLNNLGLL